MSRLLLLLTLLAACVSSREAPPAPLDFELSGCRSVRPGSAKIELLCELTEHRELRIRADGSLKIESGGQVLTATIAELAGGTLHTLSIRPGATELLLSREGRAARLMLSSTERIAAIEDAQRAQKAGDSAAADRILAASVEALPKKDRPRVIRERARLARGRGDAAAFTFYHQALDLLAEGHRFCEAADYALAVAFTATRLGRRFDLARQALERHSSLIARARGCADPAARAPYYSGVLSLETGDLVSALAAFEEAERRTHRLGMAADEDYAAQGRALALEQLGRNEEAWRLLEARAARPRTPCDRALASADRGWVGLMLYGAREESDYLGPKLAETRALFEDALVLYGVGDGKCDSPAARANVEINLALVALEEKRVEEAGVRIRSAREAFKTTDPPLELWIGDVEGRVALAGGRFRQAETIYTQLAQLAGELASEEAQWRAAIGRAAALEQLGRHDTALDMYRVAESILDRESVLLPLGRGRETFLSTRQKGTQRFVELLEKSGQRKEALRVARDAAVRTLALVSKTGRLARLSEAERIAWDDAIAKYRQGRDELEQLVGKRWMASKRTLAGWKDDHAQLRSAVESTLQRALAVVSNQVDRAELRPVGPGELILFYQASHTGGVAFAAGPDRIEAHRFKTTTESSVEELAASLLAPFSAQIAAAERIRLMPQGPLKKVDLHVLPWNGRPLYAQKTIAYAVDRPGVLESTNLPFAKTLLLVADPNNDLSSARAEAGALRAKFLAQPVTLLEGSKATGTAVRAALREHELFHFAGHAVSGGDAGWESALLLARDDRLEIADILSLTRAPRFVVLMACESGSLSSRTAVNGLGLAHAFIASGSEEVIAASRILEDQSARQISQRIHSGLLQLRKQGEQSWLLPEALRRAQLELEGTSSDFAALRAFVP
jgi:CHAT domain-containing protein